MNLFIDEFLNGKGLHSKFDLEKFVPKDNLIIWQLHYIDDFFSLTFGSVGSDEQNWPDRFQDLVGPWFGLSSWPSQSQVWT